MATRTTHDEERLAYADFAILHSDEIYRTRLAELYASWGEFNEEFFAGEGHPTGRLRVPHLAIGRSAPRSLGHCSGTTDYGGKVQLTLNAGLVFGTNLEWVVSPLPAVGTRRFINDLLLRLAVRQYVLETLGDEEPGYRGYGPKFVEQANRIGVALGLGPVVARRRGTVSREQVASGWPHCVRPPGYYGDDITETALGLAGGLTRRRRSFAAPSLGLLELLVYLLTAGRADDARRLVVRHLDWLRAASESRWPTRRQVEAGAQDVDGSPLGEVVFDPAWLKWTGGTVRNIAAGVQASRTFEDLPILADALEEAGCKDGRFLRHLRERMEHGPRCWVLRLLLALDAE